MSKIIEITEVKPSISTLPDGNYLGVLSGYVIKLKYKDKSYELKVNNGIRGTSNVLVKFEVRYAKS